MTGAIPSSILQSINSRLDEAEEIKNFSFVGGGCINHGGELTTSRNSYFLKWNDSNAYPNMFESEAKGLAYLERANAIDVPKVVFTSALQDFQFILMEFRRPKQKVKNFWSLFGSRLAKLHQQTSTMFGLDHDNYIGVLPQSNRQHKTWIDFFLKERLEKQFSLAIKRNLFDREIEKKFDKLFVELPSLIPVEKPSLLHGDLWSGNLIVNEKGEPCLIDPAIYFGHREADLAMTQLFGGFDNTFFDAYQEVNRLEKRLSRSLCHL